MKKIFVLHLFFLLIGSSLLAKAPSVLWTKYFGGSGSDRTYNVLETPDGGFISCGHGNSFGKGWNIYLIKMNANGDTLWTKIIGDTVKAEYIYSLEPTADGGYIACGDKMMSDYSSNAYLIKFDSDFNIQWEQNYGQPKIGESGNWAVQTPEGGYILVARVQSDYAILVVKTDSLGNQLKSKTYDWELQEEAASVCIAHDGNYILGGITNSFLTKIDETFILKIDRNLDSLWMYLYGDHGDLEERFRHISRTSDNGFLMVGARAQVPGHVNSHDVYIVKTNSDGIAEWEKIYGGDGHQVGFYGAELSGGDFIVSGTGAPRGGSFDAYVLRLTKTGDTLWTAYYGTTAFDELLCIRPLKNGGYILAGHTPFYSTDEDFYFIRLADDVNPVEEKNSSPQYENKSFIEIYPNPLNTAATFKLVLKEAVATELNIHDILGNQIASLVNKRLDAGTYYFNFNSENLPGGIYLYILKTNNEIFMRQMLLIK